MKKSVFFSMAMVVCITVISFSQNIEGSKSVLKKHARISIESIDKNAKSHSSGIKLPNPHWNPKPWTHSTKNILHIGKTIENKNNFDILDSPIPDTSFIGLIDNASSIPPDVNGAVGPNHLVQTLNTDVRISDKRGNELFTTSLSTWWESMPGNGGTFDPKIIYDPYAEKWLMITPSGSTATTSRIYIAVSTSSNPMDDWYFYYIDTDPEYTLWFDYPNLGFNKKWISIGGIMRNSAFEAVEFVVYTFDKIAAYNGEDEPILNRFTTTLGSAIVPSFTYDEFAEDLYLISTGNGNFEGNGYINLFKLSGTAEDVEFNLLGSIGIPEPWENWSYENHGDFLPQLGSSEKLNSVDARMHTMIHRNNKLWAVHHIYLPADNPTYTAIQWIKLDTTGIILDRGRVEDPNMIDCFAFPSIAVNAREDVLIGHGVFSPNHYASAGYSYRDNEDEPGMMRNYHVYKDGLAPYYKTFGGDRNRWGDYSAVVVDPIDDIDFWAVHEYADNPSGSDRWATWWAFVKPSFPPIADFIADNVLIPVGETVDFTDISLGIPNQWLWEFENAIPATSDAQNPSDILFDEEESFDISLIVTNDLGVDTIIKENFITTSSSILPEVAFTSDTKVVCVGKEVAFEDRSIYSPIQWEWQFDPSTVSFSNGTDEYSQNPMVVFEEATSYSVSLKVWNLNGFSEITKFDLIKAGGYIPYYKETFEDEMVIDEEWLIENPDGDISWELYEVGGTLPGNKAMGIDFSSYLIGKRDRLLSPAFNLENMSGAWLDVKHAYSKKYPPISDSLIIAVSADCGENWSRIFVAGEDGNGSFATADASQDFWPVQSTDWCGQGWGAECINLDLSSYVGNANVMVAFESYSAIGNPLFIDNISLSQYLGTDDQIFKNNDVQLFPNPTSGDFSIILPQENNYHQLKLINQMGQMIYESPIDSKSNTIEVSVLKNMNRGTYLLLLIGEKEIDSKKLILE